MSKRTREHQSKQKDEREGDYKDGYPVPLEHDLNDGMVDKLGEGNNDESAKSPVIDELREMASSLEGGELSRAFSDFKSLMQSSSLNIGIADHMRSIFRVLALVVGACDCKTFKGASSVMFLYVEPKWDTHCEYILNAFARIFNNGCQIGISALGPSLQGGSENALDEEQNWSEFYNHIQGKWRELVKSKFFPMFQKLLALASVFGLVTTSDMPMSKSVVDTALSCAQRMKEKPSTLIDCIFSVVDFVMDNCLRAWKTKSLAPLFEENSTLSELDSRCITIEGEWQKMQQGLDWDDSANARMVVFEHEIHQVQESLTEAIKSSKLGSPVYRSLSGRVAKLQGISSAFQDYMRNKGLRKAPFSLEVYGASSVGKTSVLDLVLRYIKICTGMPLDPECVYPVNPSLKHFDGFKSYKYDVRLDDFGNTKPDFIEVAPTELLMRLCNNAQFVPPMAHLEHKGTTDMRPVFVSTTTNVSHLDARTYSNEPYSIQRRMMFVLEVKVKPEFVDETTGGLHPGKAGEYSMVDGEKLLLPDLWDISVSRFVRPPLGRNEIGGSLELVKDPQTGEELKDRSIAAVANFLLDEYIQHDKAQDIVVSQDFCGECQEECPHPGCRRRKLYCPLRAIHCKSELQSGGLVLQATQCGALGASYHEFVTSVATWMLTKPILYYIMYVIGFLVGSIGIKLRMRRLTLLEGVLITGKICILFTFIQYLNTTRDLASALQVIIPCGFALSIARFCYDVNLRVSRYLMTTQSIIDRAASLVTKRNIAMSTCSIFVLFTTWKLMMRFCNRGRRGLQGSLRPTTMEEINARDAEINPWLKTNILKRRWYPSDVSATTTTEDLGRLCTRNTISVSIRNGDGTGFTGNVVALSTNLFLFPGHFLREGRGDFSVAFLRDEPERPSSAFYGSISESQIWRVPDKDLAVVYSGSGGDFKSLLPFLPLEESSGQFGFSHMYRNGNGIVEHSTGRLLARKTHHCESSFYGGDYLNFTRTTFKGLCGSVVLAETPKPVILGVHVAGTTGSQHGVMCSILLDEVEKALEYFRDKKFLVVGVQAGDEVGVRHGVNFRTDTQPLRSSPLRFLETEASFAYVGGCIGKTTSRSTFKRSLISASVEEILGIPYACHPPKMKPDYFGYQKAMSGLADPSVPHVASVLDWARQDFISPFLDEKMIELWKSEVRVLTDKETVNGIPGKKFIDPMVLTTSAGFPLGGKKKDYLVDSTDATIGNREFVESIQNDIESCRIKLEKGERVNFVAKACKKDEILTKENKMRIFYGQDITQIYLMRQYFLSLARFVQLNSILSECAVGINPNGPEWNEFHDHVFKFGEERLLGGDYGSYDQKLNSQLLLCAFSILLEIAEKFGFEKNALNIMRGLSVEVVYANIAFNGDLIQLESGGHVSGNSLTVVLNSICNSLNMRCAFAHPKMARGEKDLPTFRSRVALMTYGDDNIGSVHSEEEDLTIKKSSEYFSCVGQIYTMPDKESELKDFLPPKDFEFLKRKSVYIPELGVHVGALGVTSIGKSLHAYLRGRSPPITEREACALNLDGAIRELFNHGREVYEDYLPKILEVARKHDLEGMMMESHMSFEDRVEMWHETYG